MTLRIDHVAWRVKDRHAAAFILCQLLGYRIQKNADGSEGFEIDFGNGDKAQSLALEPERLCRNPPQKYRIDLPDLEINAEYHLPLEVFVSDGTQGSLVGEWVAARGGVGGIHHIAVSVDSVETTMREWQAVGVEFSTPEPVRCPPDLVQIFTVPLPQLGGIVLELIERQDFGFCASSVKRLMESSR